MNRHPHVKVCYRLPDPPSGFDQPCVIRFRDGSLEFDFLSTKRHDFASEAIDILPHIDWPFVAGHTPSRHDWEAVGFACLDC